MSPRAIKTLPLIRPVLPDLRPDPFSDPDWVFEPKYDGFRGVLYLARRLAIFGSKRANVLTRFRALAEAIQAELPARDLILDGEVVALNPAGQMDFRALLSGQGTLHYVAFDILWHNGRDLRVLPLWRRQQRLAKLVPAPTEALSRVLVVPEAGRELFEAVQRLDLEGIVAKRKADPYTPDVTWYKIKNRMYSQIEGRGELFHGPR